MKIKLNTHKTGVYMPVFQVGISWLILFLTIENVVFASDVFIVMFKTPSKALSSKFLQTKQCQIVGKLPII
jgi:hypothetical protein